MQDAQLMSHVDTDLVTRDQLRLVPQRLQTLEVSFKISVRRQLLAQNLGFVSEICKFEHGQCEIFFL